MEKLSIFKLDECRVRRNYVGGKILDEMAGRENAVDGECPESWLGSLTLAGSTGLAPIENEGLGFVFKDGKKVWLPDLFAENPDFYLGKEHFQKKGMDYGFLAKLIDSSIRLHMQAHPSREFAKAHLGCEYGKFECYYILAAREGSDSYVRLGFNHPVTKEEWTDIVKTQDIARMDALFEKIYVKPGEMLYIPGGVPHAIGEGVLLVEVMEPSDLVVRCEYERNGIVVPEEGRMMGRGVDFCMDVFEYETLTPQEIKAKYFVEPTTLASGKGWALDQMLSPEIAKCFEVRRFFVTEECEIPKAEEFMLGIITKGSAIVECDKDKVDVKLCDSFFISASTNSFKVAPKNGEAFEFIAVVGVK